MGKQHIPDINSYTVGLDLGTTNLKAVALSPCGKIVSSVSAPMEYDEDGPRVEFDAECFYTSVCGLVRKVVAGAPENAIPEAVCISSASGNTVLLDCDDKPLLPAVSWLDARQRDEIEKIVGSIDYRKLYERVGWPLGGGFPLAHLCRLKCENPGILDKARKIGMSSDYINLRFCGRWAMDHSTATTFYFQDQIAGRWHKPFLKALGIDSEKLPELLPVGTMIGKMTSNSAADTSLPPGTPVVLGSFDHPSAAFGSGIVNEGQLLLSCGTSWVGFTPVRDRRRLVALNLLIDPYLREKGLWGGYFSLPNIGRRIDGIIDKLLPCQPKRYAEFDALAEWAPTGLDRLSINPFEPYDDFLKRYPPPEIARAVMVGTARLLKDQLAILTGGGIPVADAVMVGGPSQSTVWPGILAEVIGLPLRADPAALFAGAAGAAMIARRGINK